jgi:two-component system sensor histidine kinase BaeS
MTPSPMNGRFSLRHSLFFRLVLAFWVVSILGIVTMALLAGRASRDEFGRFVNSLRYQGLIDNLAVYYDQHEGFEGAEMLFTDSQLLAEADTREFLVVDPAGNILLANTTYLLVGMPSTDLIRFGYPIHSEGLVVAYLIPMRPPRNPDQLGTKNIQRINLNLWVGVLIATLIALVTGGVVARNIIQPMRELDSAAQAIAQGDLEKQVSVSAIDEIGRLATSFNRMIESLKLSRDQRRKMIADIAHELRNPLSIIMGNAEALSEGVLPATPEALAIIYDESRHLSRLVDDLRTLSLSESGELRLEISMVAPEDILQRCAAAYAVRAAEHGIELKVESTAGLVKYPLDMERILQVLANLVDNSLKHTPAGGSIVLGAGQHADGGLNLTVSDDGPGISADDLPWVFDRFYRGKAAPGRIMDGSGLGLAISRSLVELHGGKIGVESSPGKGTRFIVHLPGVVV